LEHKHDPVIYNYIFGIQLYTRMNGYKNLARTIYTFHFFSLSKIIEEFEHMTNRMWLFRQLLNRGP